MICRNLKTSGLLDEFEEDYQRNLEQQKTFGELVLEIMRTKFAYEWINDEEDVRRVKISNKVTFERVLGLSSSVYDKIAKNSGKNTYIPSASTLFSIAIAYQLSMVDILLLMDAAGTSIRKTDLVQSAYCFLITNCRGHGFEYCNKLLKDIGISEKYYLGRRAKRKAS